MKHQHHRIHRVLTGFGFLFTSHLYASPVSLPIAQVPPALKNSFQFALGIIFLVGFIWGVVKIWGGADRMSKGDTDGKMGIVSGIFIAGAAAIMGALFSIFGLAGGALTPQF